MNEARLRIPGHLARRLDRLSVAAHRFHRFAHHPLCAEYAGEVFRLGRKIRICKGCTLAGLGALAGLAAGGFARQLPSLAFLGLAFGLLPLLTVSFLFHARHEDIQQPLPGSPEAGAFSASHRAPPSRGKLLSRFMPSAIIAFLFMLGLRIGGAIGDVGALLALGQVALVLIVYRRRGPQRLPCSTCPERFEMSRCRGYQEIRRRERAFQRLADRILHRPGN